MSPKHLAASGAIKAGPGALFALTLTAVGANATAVVYDNTSAAGTVIWKLAALDGTSNTVSLPNGAAFGVGAYAALTGAGATLSASCA